VFLKEIAEDKKKCVRFKNVSAADEQYLKVMSLGNEKVQ